MRNRLVAGGVLIVLGVITLAVTRFARSDVIAPLVIGSAFMVWFAFSQSYGLLIPACIMTGIGAGVVFDSMYRGVNEPVLLCLGLGFIAIYVIDRLMGNRRPGGWWPLIPGGILLLVGWQALFVSEILQMWWPLALVIIGLILVLRQPRVPSGPDRSSGPEAPGGPQG